MNVLNAAELEMVTTGNCYTHFAAFKTPHTQNQTLLTWSAYVCARASDHAHFPPALLFKAADGSTLKCPQICGSELVTPERS